MKILVDMNLSPLWAQVLRDARFESVHWSGVGAHDAADSEIILFAERGEWIVLTQDLDFGAILVAGSANAPSVVQLRTGDTSHATLAPTVIEVLRSTQKDLASGALVTVSRDRTRVRILPFGLGR